jgi:hypothetical protein
MEMPELDHPRLRQAARDFLYLMDRSYPRSASLHLVGNRYQLDALQRNILHRGIFARLEAEQRRARLAPPEQLARARLLVDGHNVLITVESALAGRLLIAANDGLMRDVAGISHRYRPSPLTHEAIERLVRVLRDFSPAETLFFLDAPIPRSGELAAALRASLKTADLPGDARALKVPEKSLLRGEGIVASSDSAVLDRIGRGFDLAAAVIRSLDRPLRLLDFSSLTTTGPPGE